ncbi:zinc finger protein, partial [Reticulomyxa filosa]
EQKKWAKRRHQKSDKNRPQSQCGSEEKTNTTESSSPHVEVYSEKNKRDSTSNYNDNDNDNDNNDNDNNDNRNANNGDKKKRVPKPKDRARKVKYEIVTKGGTKEIFRLWNFYVPTERPFLGEGTYGVVMLRGPFLL